MGSLYCDERRRFHVHERRGVETGIEGLPDENYIADKTAASVLDQDGLIGVGNRAHPTIHALDEKDAAVGREGIDEQIVLSGTVADHIRIEQNVRLLIAVVRSGSRG